MKIQTDRQTDKHIAPLKTLYPLTIVGVGNQRRGNKALSMLTILKYMNFNGPVKH